MLQADGNGDSLVVAFLKDCQTIAFKCEEHPNPSQISAIFESKEMKSVFLVSENKLNRPL